MSLTVPATSHLHAQTNRASNPLHSERGFLQHRENVVRSASKLHIDSQPDFTSPCFKPDMLTNFRNPESLCAERQEEGRISSSIMTKRGDESSSDKSAWQKPDKDDGLDLSLGLSSFKWAPKIVDNKSANESVANQILQRERVSTTHEHERGGSLPQQTIQGNNQKPFPERLPDLVMSHPWKPQVNGARLTAAQIWHTIQSSSSYPQMGMHAGAGAFNADLWPQLSHRSASMPFMESLGRQGSDTSALQRATSVTSQQFVDCQPSSLVSGIPRTESLQNKSISSQNHRHQEEVQELQRKKDLQAQKRQEARKRRKSLIEGKQLKRAKREESKFILQTKGSLINSAPLLRTTSASLTRQDGGCSPNRDGGCLQRMGSGRLVQSWETPFRVNIPLGSADKNSERVGDLEERKRGQGSPDCKSEEENSMQSNGDNKDEDVGGRCIQAACVSETTTVVQSSDGRPKATDLGAVNGMYVSELDARERHLVKPSLSEDCQSNSESRGDLPKPISRTQTRVENRDSLSQNRESEQSMEAVASSIPLDASSAVTSSALPCAATSFPVFPVAYPLPMPVSTSIGLPLQMGFSIPCFMQFLAPQSSSVIKEDPKATCPQVLTTPFHFPTCSELTSYRPPLSEACSSWFAVTESQSVVPPLPRASSAKGSDGSMDHDRASSNQTQAKDVEMQMLSPNSVQLSSLKASKGHQNCFAPKSRKLHGHASDVGSQKPLPQPSLTRTLSDSAAQFVLTRTVSDSAAYSMDFKSTEHVIQRKGSGEPFVSKAASVLEKSLILPISRAPVQECAKTVPLLHKEEKGERFSSQSNGVDTIASEVCNNSKHNVSIGAGNMGMEDSNTEPSLTIKGKASDTGPFRDLPRVSATGPAPNGRTVTGVMYIFNKKYVKIVCTCHAMHMSPSEFVQHAGHTDLSNPERNILVNPFPCVC